MKFHVYIYLDTRKPGRYPYQKYDFLYAPFYVGKGQGKRWKQHLFEAFTWDKSIGPNTLKINVIRKIKKETGQNPQIFKIENLTEKQALELEKKLVAHFGRRDLGTGILTNMTDGGDGGNPMKGRKQSAKTKKLISDSKIGKPLTPEHKVALSLAALSEKRNTKLRKHYENMSEDEHNHRSIAMKNRVAKLKADPEKFALFSQRQSKAQKNSSASKATPQRQKLYQSEEEKRKVINERR